MTENSLIDPLKEVPHHKQQEICSSRPAYRQGRKLTAVKVFSIASESQHLFVYGVPKISLRNELKALLNKYGQISRLHVVEDHEVELFTECYHVQFQRIQSARIAKRLIDNRSFYGGILHVCYAPEYETLEETMAKLQQREKDVLSRLSRQSTNHKQATPSIQSEKTETSSPISNEYEQSIDEVAPLYDANDPILSLNKRLKRDHAQNIHKYLSQSSDVNGGPMNRSRGPRRVLNTKKFIPSTLRSKKELPKSQDKFIGPQFPSSNETEFQNSIESQNQISDSS